MKQKTTAHFWAVDECFFLLREAKYEKISRHAKRGVELHSTLLDTPGVSQWEEVNPVSSDMIPEGWNLESRHTVFTIVCIT